MSKETNTFRRNWDSNKIEFAGPASTTLNSLASKFPDISPTEMSRLIIGIPVAVTRGSEVWVGSTALIKKPHKYVLYVDVKEYHKDGTLRTKFQPRVVQFGNSADTQVYRLANKTQEDTQRAEARQAYSQARSMMQDARSEMDKNLRLLGAKESISKPEFKELRKKFLMAFHPDRKQVYIDQGGSPEKFDKASEAITNALSWLDQFIQRRDA